MEKHKFLLFLWMVPLMFTLSKSLIIIKNSINLSANSKISLIDVNPSMIIYVAQNSPHTLNLFSQNKLALSSTIVFNIAISKIRNRF